MTRDAIDDVLDALARSGAVPFPVDDTVATRLLERGDLHLSVQRHVQEVELRVRAERISRAFGLSHGGEILVVPARPGLAHREAEGILPLLESETIPSLVPLSYGIPLGRIRPRAGFLYRVHHGVAPLAADDIVAVALRDRYGTTPRLRLYPDGSLRRRGAAGETPLGVVTTFWLRRFPVYHWVIDTKR